MEETRFRRAVHNKTPCGYLKSGEIEPFPADGGTGVVTAAAGLAY